MNLKCAKCGKFISHKDYDSGKLIAEDVWSWDKTEILDTEYFCLKCKPNKIPTSPPHYKNLIERNERMKTEDQIKQERIDELYRKVWNLVDEINTLKSQVLEIGEEMKEIVSSEAFK